MNYENLALKELESKLNEAKELLNEVKTSFSKEALKKSLNESLSELKAELRSYVKSFVKKENEALKEDLKAKNEALLWQNKDEIKNEFINSFDKEALSLEVAKSFLNENKKNLFTSLSELLEKSEFKALFAEKEKDLKDSFSLAKQKLESEFKKALSSLSFGLDERLFKLSEFMKKLVSFFKDTKN